MSGKDVRDDIIGSLLSRRINNAGVKGECPSLEDIAAFMDDRLDDRQERLMMDHLSSCNACYEIFSETAKTMHDEQVHAETGKRKALYYAIPSALAVAAMIFLIIKLSDKPLQPQQATIQHERTSEKPLMPEDAIKGKTPESIVKEYSPPSISNIVNVLSKESDMKALAGSIKTMEATTFGFAGSLSMEKQAFVAGGYLIDLEIALKADDKERSLALLEKLISSLKAIEVTKAITVYYQYIEGKIKKGASPKGFLADSQAIEGELKKKNLIFLHLGGWVEGGRLASISQNKAFFEPETARYFKKELKNSTVPEWVMNSMDDVERIAAKGYDGDMDFKRLRRLFEEMQQGLIGVL